MKKIRNFIVAIFLVFSFSIFGQAVVNLGKTNQMIDGFGASSAWCGAINDNVMNALYGDLGYSILRLRIEEGIGDNWKTGNLSSWNSELSNAKKATAKGAKVFASPWNAPASMRESFTKSGDTDPWRLRYDKYQEYTDYLNTYVKYMKDNGVNLYAISVQNEPDYGKDWTWWTPTEMLNFVKNYAGSINTKVIAPESFQYLKNMSDPLLNDATALANVDILGFHLYGTPVSQFTYPLFTQKGAGKSAWMTEHYYDTDGITDIMNMSKELHNCMAANMNAYVYWWITWANGLATSSGTIYKRAYVLGQFAKFIRPGYYRVDATANPSSNVFVTAYTGSGKAVIVVVNTGTSAVNQVFSFQNGMVSSVTPYTTDITKNMVTGSNISVSNNSFTAQIPAQSIMTFVGDLGNVPTVKFTSPTANTVYTVGTPITLSANATITSGSIANVKFYDGTTLLNTDNASPYSYSWATATAGKHLLKVVATDNVGNTAFDTLTIKVNVAQAPYGGTAWGIPGVIQLENYDVGGNKVAYYDSTAGSEVSPVVNFRTDEDVDIETCTDVGGGYNIGYATKGEWLEYTVKVNNTATYDLDLRVACNGTGRTVSVSMDGVNIASNVAIPNTGGWQTWQTVTVSGIPLTAGQKVMRLTVGNTDYVNLNYVEYKVVTDVEEHLSQNQLNISPNPFDENGINVHGHVGSKYKITSVAGVELENGFLRDNVSVAKHLPIGTYLLTLENGNTSKTVLIMRK
ncbi:MAG: carbohydrate-binding protein [Cytophagales bacterium]